MTAPAQIARPRIANADARRLFLAKHGLSETGREPPGVDGLLTLVDKLGFVQVDSINTVERAHHMILSARLKSYRPHHLRTLLERRRDLFEHWTHDAAIIPTAFYPHWRLRFARDRDALVERWRKWRPNGFEDKFDEVLEHIRANGPVLARDLGDDEPQKSGGWWEWRPSKTALEFLWRTGELAVSRRDGFQKVFDLAERVIPDGARGGAPAAEETIAWASAGAVDRLGFATSGEIAKFWDKISPQEAKDWCARECAAGALIEVEIDGADRAAPARRAFARPDVFEAIAAASPPPGRIRVLSPFDPAIRDRKRAERLFGFDYRIEVFTPAAKRRYGYYVFPLLEGDAFVGRIDMQRNADAARLDVRAVWPERGVAFGKGRRARLESELHRVARFCGCDAVDFADGWLREPM